MCSLYQGFIMESFFFLYARRQWQLKRSCLTARRGLLPKSMNALLRLEWISGEEIWYSPFPIAGADTAVWILFFFTFLTAFSELQRTEFELGLKLGLFYDIGLPCYISFFSRSHL